MQTESVRDFHFVMAGKMKESLESLNSVFNGKGLSGVIVKILKKLIPVIRKEHKWGEQRLSKYKAVCNDSEEMRKHVHVYVPDALYRELKLLHQDLNFYSIAQLVRELIDLFLELVVLYKDDVFVELKKIFDRWKAEAEDSRLTTRKLIRQLWKLIRFLPGKNRLVTIYNNSYSPFWIFRI